MSPRNLQYACAISGIVVLILNLVGFAASGFLPPIPPSWDAERTAEHYREHEKGILAGAALMAISSMPYLAYTAAISAQMRRIPNLPYAARALQLASGAVAAVSFLMSGVILAVADYRLDRPAEITQALNDLFWFISILPWPAFAAQDLGLAYAIIFDCRLNPLFPKPIAMVNIVASLLFVPSIALPCFKNGPLAWNGSVSFWIPISVFGVQVVIDSICLVRAVSTDAETGEKVVDVQPTGLGTVDKMV